MDVVRKNVEALRGRIEISSKAGVGSTFTVRLPLTLGGDRWIDRPSGWAALHYSDYQHRTEHPTYIAAAFHRTGQR